MKALSIVLLLFFSFSLVSFQPAHALAEPHIRAHAAVLVDAESGQEIFGLNSDTVMYPASTTKIMTALLAVEHGDMDQLITIGNEVNMIAWDSSRAHLQRGDRLRLRDVVYGMMLASGNDAAYSVAVHIARTKSENPYMPEADALKLFAQMMNERAREAGARNTNFFNPDGYPHRNHYTTAKDLALIMAEAMKNPDFREFDGTDFYSPTTLSNRVWKNGNYLIQRESGFFYDKAIGGKTGFTHPAGFTMVASAAHNDLELVAVALKTDADGRWLDTTGLLEYGFDNYQPEPGPLEEEITTLLRAEEQVTEAGEQVAEAEGVLPWPLRLLQWLNLL